MMQFDPTLIVERMIIKRERLVVYDERFHVGVNIVTGDNSSGKSTILNFIFYGLGGDLSDWSDVALSCSRVILQTSINGLIVTVAREVSKDPMRPMEIYPGSFDDSEKGSLADWTRYPYKRSANLESFSQAIFRLLRMPEVVSDVTGSLTMHQVLRLLYADQLSPVDQIFKHEPFDPSALRDSVGRLLCGAYDSEVYNNEARLKELNRKLDSANAELRGLLSVLGRTEQAHTLDWIVSQRQTLSEERERLRKDIEVAEAEIYDKGVDDRITLKAQESAYHETRRMQKEIALAEENISRLQLSYSDSEIFIRSLERKVEALSDSRRVAENLGSIRFQTCPACYAAISQDEERHECHLCKTPFEQGPAFNRIVALITEAGRQLKQSLVLQERRREQIKGAEELLPALQATWAQSAERLQTLQNLPSTELRARLRELNRQAGYMERQAEDLESKTAIANAIDKLSESKADLSQEIARIRTRNEVLRSSQALRLQTSSVEIEREILGFLHGDLERQDAFVAAKHVKFDFGANQIGVDEQQYFSASSRVILKSSFFIGFMFAATKDKGFRHPRFCIVDTIEDKGMEQVRSHNFQRMIVAKSKVAKVNHQIIFATAMIAPELKDKDYVVGAHSTLKKGSIAIERAMR